MVLRVWLMAMLFVVASSSGYGSSRFPKTDLDPSLYDILQVNNFTATKEEITAHAEEILAAAYAGQQNPKFFKVASNTVSQVKKALETLKEPGSASRYMYNVELAEYLLANRNGYEAVGVSFSAKTQDMAKVFMGITYALRAQRPAGVDVDYELRANQAARGYEDLQRTFNDKDARKKYNSQISKTNPISKNMNPVSRGVYWGLNTAVGSVGYMVGYTSISLLTARMTDDPSLTWAALDMWSDWDQAMGLVGFGLGSTAASGTIKGSYRFVTKVIGQERAFSPGMANYLGMVFGNGLQHFEQKFVHSEHAKAMTDMMKEYSKDFHTYGSLVMSRNYIGSQIELHKEKLFSSNPQERAEAQTKIKELNDKYSIVAEKCTEHRQRLQSAMKVVWDDTTNLAPNEMHDLMVSAGEMILASVLARQADKFILAAWSFAKAKKKGWLNSDGTINKASQAMTAEELEEFNQLVRRIESLKTYFKMPNAVLSQQAPEFMRELAESDQIKLNIIRQKYRSYINQQVEKAIAGVPNALGGVIKIGRAATLSAEKIASSVGAVAAGTKEFILPDMAFVATQNLSGASAYAMAGRQLLGRLTMSSWSSFLFVLLNGQTGKISKILYPSIKLEDQVKEPLKTFKSTALDFVGDGISNEIDRDWQNGYVTALNTSLTQYKNAWDEYSSNVISADSTAAYKRWLEMREKMAHKMNNETFWLRWLENGASFDDPQFIRNGGKTGQEWHADPMLTPKVFAAEKEHYSHLPGLVDLTPPNIKKYLDYWRSVEEDQEYKNAQDMHKHMVPMLAEDYYKKTNFMLKYSTGYVKSVWDILTLKLGNMPGDFLATNFQLPGNWWEADVLAQAYLKKTCTEIAPQLPQTPVVIEMTMGCSGKIPFKEFLSSKRILSRARDLEGWPENLPYSLEMRADYVAVSVVAQLQSIIMEKNTLKAKLDTMNEQPVNAQEAEILAKKGELHLDDDVIRSLNLTPEQVAAAAFTPSYHTVPKAAGSQLDRDDDDDGTSDGALQQMEDKADQEELDFLNKKKALFPVPKENTKVLPFNPSARRDLEDLPVNKKQAH